MNTISKEIMVGIMVIMLIGLGTISTTSKIIDTANNDENVNFLENINNQIGFYYPKNILPQPKLIKLLVTINGTGETEKELDVFENEWRIIFDFKFTNEDADMKIGAFGIPLWKIFPCIFNPIGPYDYRAVLFYGSVNKINTSFHIEGYCMAIYLGN